MDPVTHALSGALLARATLPRRDDAAALPRGRHLLVGTAAASIPDLDFVIGFAGPVEYLYHHRGVTHSLLMLPLWALLLAWLCTLIWRDHRSWRAYCPLIAAGIGLHIAGDWITSFGTMLFAPVSDARYALGTTFIIDLWLTGLIVAGLAASWAWRTPRAPAVAGLLLVAGYVVFQSVQLDRALDFGREYARRAGLDGARVTAQPRPVSPFNWMVIVSHGDRVEYSFVNLVRREPLPAGPEAGFIRRLDAPYLPRDQAQWVPVARFGVSPEEQAVARAAWAHPQFGFFRWFAAEPVLYRVESHSPVCAWFQDLRFFTPGRDAWPFRYGMCRAEDGSWRRYELEGGLRIPLP